MMNYSKKITASTINDSRYVVQGGQLSLSNRGQLELLMAMIENDAALRTTARGLSMHPFICDKDILTISPIKNGKLSVGDVVAFTHPDTGRLAIHRIIGQTDKGWLIRGDNCTEADGIVPNEKIIGRVCCIERCGKKKNLGIGKAGKFIAFFNRINLLLRAKQILVLSRNPFFYFLRLFK